MSPKHTIAFAVIFGILIAKNEYTGSALFIFIGTLIYYLKKTNNQYLKALEDNL